MAGNYPDVPGHRMPYDVDGTQVFNVSNPAAVTQVSQVNLANGNREYGSILFGITHDTSRQYAMIFPEVRTITGFYLQGLYAPSTGTSGLYAFETSVDTTNGIDGTWVQRIGGGSVQGYLAIYSPTSYRTNITAVNWVDIKAIRFGASTSGSNERHTMDVFHVYGHISGTENLNRLELWHPSLDQRVSGAYFDWGDARRGTNAVRTFRIKNQSATMTANSISVTLGALFDTTPTNVSQHSLSTDGVNFSSSISIGDLAPGAVSGELSLRRSTSGSAVLSLWALRIRAAATSWT